MESHETRKQWVSTCGPFFADNIRVGACSLDAGGALLSPAYPSSDFALKNIFQKTAHSTEGGPLRHRESASTVQNGPRER